jgi:rRNA maturation protein Rpf1
MQHKRKGDSQVVKRRRKIGILRHLLANVREIIFFLGVDEGNPANKLNIKKSSDFQIPAIFYISSY